MATDLITNKYRLPGAIAENTVKLGEDVHQVTGCVVCDKKGQIRAIHRSMRGPDCTIGITQLMLDAKNNPVRKIF